MYVTHYCVDNSETLKNEMHMPSAQFRAVVNNRFITSNKLLHTRVIGGCHHETFSTHTKTYLFESTLNNTITSFIPLSARQTWHLLEHLSRTVFAKEQPTDLAEQRSIIHAIAGAQSMQRGRCRCRLR